MTYYDAAEDTGGMVVMDHITKSYGPVRVLTDVSLSVRRGEVLGLVGKNGAGKSTLMKILAGVVPADRGEVRIAKEAFDPTRDSERMRHHVAMVFQERSLAESMSVADNILLGELPTTRWGFLDRRTQVRLAAEILRSLSITVDPSEQVSRLSTAVKQSIEVAKAVLRRRGVLIMDEPTAALSADHVQELFSLIRALQAQGVTIVFISHDLRRVLEICDRVSVLRDGRNVLEVDSQSADVNVLAEAMTGESGIPSAALQSGGARRLGPPLLEVEDLEVNGKVRGISFTLHEGEVLGVVGLTGSGKTELLEALFGISPPRRGHVSVGGSVLPRLTPAVCRRAGLTLVPDDRHLKGLVTSLSVRSNLLLPVLHDLAGRLLSDERGSDTLVARLIHSLGIIPPDPAKVVLNLSGGNQQKVSLARCVSTRARVFLFDDPTVGVDVQSKREIGRLIRDLVGEGGGATLLVSSELDFIEALADRVLVIRDGRIAHEVPAEGGEMTETRLLALM